MIAASTKMAALLLVVGSLQFAARVDAAPVRTEKAACERVKTRVSAARHFPMSTIAFCDMVGTVDSPRGFYVLALHSNRRCEGICSTNMGWFAVEKRTGRVLEWDVAEDRLGQPIKPYP